MSEWRSCPSCGLKHLPRPDGLCPRCHGRVGDAAQSAFGADAGAGPFGAPPASSLEIFEVLQANTWTQDLLFDVHVGKDRFVCVKTGGQFSAQGGGAVVAGLLFGALGGLIYSAFAKPGAAAARKAQERLARSAVPFDALVRSDKHNFEVPFLELEAIGVRKVRFTLHGPAVAALTYRRRGQEPKELLLRGPESARSCVSALRKTLGPRLEVDPALKL